MSQYPSVRYSSVDLTGKLGQQPYGQSRGWPGSTYLPSPEPTTRYVPEEYPPSPSHTTAQFAAVGLGDSGQQPDQYATSSSNPLNNPYAPGGPRIVPHAFSGEREPLLGYQQPSHGAQQQPSSGIRGPGQRATLPTGGDRVRRTTLSEAGATYRAEAKHASSIVRMRRGEAWAKFLAYEGSCQVCMKAASSSNQYALQFLSSGCSELRVNFGIDNLLLSPINAAMLSASINRGENMEVGTEIMWDDIDSSDRRLGATAFMNSMSYLKLRVGRLQMHGKGLLSKLACKRNALTESCSVGLRLSQPHGDELRFHVNASGMASHTSAVMDLRPDHQHYDIIVEVHGRGQQAAQGMQPATVAKGALGCRRIWQLAADLSHSNGDEEGCDEEPPPPGGSCWCRCFTELFGCDKESSCCKHGNAFIWVRVYDSSQDQVGAVMLNIHRVQRELTTNLMDDGDGRGPLRITAPQSYDYLLDAALLAQRCGEKKLEVTGEWAWLLNEYANSYGVKAVYALMSHLRWVLKPAIASVTKPCLELICKELRPLLEQEGLGGGALSPGEGTLLAHIKASTEELLRLAFENYYALDKSAPKGIVEGVGLVNEFPPEALPPAMRLFEAMRDVFHPTDLEWLADRFRVAAKKRWSRLAALCDDVPTYEDATAKGLVVAPDMPLRINRKQLSSNKNTVQVTSKPYHVYKRVESVCQAIRNELEYDMRLQEVPGLLPTSINLPGITAAEYCTSFLARLRVVLQTYPPHEPTEPAVDLLVAVARLERYLSEHSLLLPRGHPGCIDALELFGPYVKSWITNSKEMLCTVCCRLEASTELNLHSTSPITADYPLGGGEEGGVAPLVHEMLRHVASEMGCYDRVISHWPIFGPYLEAAMCIVLRAVIAAVSRQCGMVQVHPDGSPLHARGAGHGKAQRVAPPAAIGIPQWTWQITSKHSASKPSSSPPRVYLMVREAVLLNSLKRLMVAVPTHEHTILRWSGGPAHAQPGQQQHGASSAPLLDDVAPHVGAQYAQVVKELRTEYGAAVSQTAERMSSLLVLYPPTSVRALLSSTTKAAAAAAGTAALTPAQQHIAMERAAEPLLACIKEAFVNLKAALDARVFVACGRGLWDYVAKQLFDFVECLQEGMLEQKGAWRARQNAAVMLSLLNTFFKSCLLSHLDHGASDRDLELPQHAARARQLLAQNTTALNMTYTPF